MDLTLNRNLQVAYYLQIAAQIKKQILQGSLPDGAALPSERRLAQTLGLHRNTIAKAYNELRADGMITARQGLGYRVSQGQQPDGEKGKAVNWSNAIKEEYLEMESPFDDLFTKSRMGGELSFAGGMAAREVYSREDIAKSIEGILATDRDTPYFYTPYQGDLELRKEMAAFLRKKGILTKVGQTQIFSENNQAFDFLATALLSPGDKVITEECLSPDSYRTIRLAGGQILPIPMDEDGMLCHRLESIIQQQKPKFIYVSNGFQNPTGRLLSIQRKKQLLQLSYAYRIPIIEEDESSDLAFGTVPIPSIKSMDPGENVIYIHSFSLTMPPGVGVSAVVASKEVVKVLRHLVSLRLISLDWLSQRLTCRFLQSGIFAEKLHQFRQIYEEKQALMCTYLQAAAEELHLSYTKPKGGVYLWLRLPDTIRPTQLTQRAQGQKVALIPGHIFYPKGNPEGNYIRLNYSYPTMEEIRKGMERLIPIMKALHKTNAPPPQTGT